MNFFQKLTPAIVIDIHERYTLLQAVGSDQIIRLDHQTHLPASTRVLHVGVIANIDTAYLIIKKGMQELAEILHLPAWIIFPRIYLSSIDRPNPVQLQAIDELGARLGAFSMRVIPSSVALPVSQGVPVSADAVVIRITPSLMEASVIHAQKVAQSSTMLFGSSTHLSSIHLAIRSTHHIELRPEEIKQVIKESCAHPKKNGAKSVEQQMVVHGRDIKTGLPKSVRLPAKVLKEQQQKFFQIVEEFVQASIADFGINAGQQALINGVYLSCDSAIGTGLAEYLTAEFGFPFHPIAQPDQAVMKGMCTYVSTLSS